MDLTRIFNLGLIRTIADPRLIGLIRAFHGYGLRNRTPLGKPCKGNINRIIRRHKGRKHNHDGRFIRSDQCGYVPFDQSRINATLCKIIMTTQCGQKSDIRRDAHNFSLRQRMVQFIQRLIPRFAMGDDLGNHRIIEWGNVI